MGHSFEDSMEETVRQVEAEVKRLITVMNDEVVPSLRRDGGKMLLKIAEQLRKMAESLER